MRSLHRAGCRCSHGAPGQATVSRPSHQALLQLAPGLAWLAASWQVHQKRKEEIRSLLGRMHQSPAGQRGLQCVGFGVWGLGFIP